MKALPFVLFFCTAAAFSAEDPAALVDPFIGAGEPAHTFPGATVPFGMVQLSPDMENSGWGGHGYNYAMRNSKSIIAFSHTHLSGTGVGDLKDVPVMPMAGELKLEPGDDKSPKSGYRSAFTHEGEVAEPGYYAVTLDDEKIRVELTATPRCGLHRYTFSADDTGHIIFDLTQFHSSEKFYQTTRAGKEPTGHMAGKPVSLEIEFTGPDTLEGRLATKGWSQTQDLYFAAKFSKPFAEKGLAENLNIKKGESSGKGLDLVGFVSFPVKAGEKVLMKVGLSNVDREGARRNLEAEIPGWDFEGVRAGARKSWNEYLGPIAIEGGTEQQRKAFYTALYHTAMAPMLYNDVDGRYRGMSVNKGEFGPIKKAEGFNYYTTFSDWDTFRTAHPLYVLVAPQRVRDFVKTMLAMQEELGIFPRWPLYSYDTKCMTGYHFVSIIQDAWCKGLRDFDAKKALSAMVKTADERSRWKHKDYASRGYLPDFGEGKGTRFGLVSEMMEMCYDDWCISQFAVAQGDETTAAEFLRRSKFLEASFDGNTGFFRAKTSDGTWVEPFDPEAILKPTSTHFVEGNAWHYLFFMPQAPETLVRLLGGSTAAGQKLDALFSTPFDPKKCALKDVTGLIGQYAHGNEPSHGSAYFYNYVGQPWKTQKMVRQIMDTLYPGKRGGESYAGNEDCGQMGAWHVMSALGFYPFCPGKPEYTIGSPLFSKATLNLSGGKKFIVIAENNSEKNIYIQSATLNGKPFDSTIFSHESVMAGGELKLVMGPEPSKWGAK